VGVSTATSTPTLAARRVVSVHQKGHLMSNSAALNLPQVLVLGGGFGGVQAAMELARTKKFRVSLISERSFLHLFPTSIWIPTRGIRTDQTRVPLTAIAKANDFTLVNGAVAGIDAATKTVQTSAGNLSYDYLVIAMGSGKMKPPGVENSESLCTGPQAAVTLREQLDALIAAGTGRIAVGFGGNPKDPSAVRGGPAFEFLFNVDHLLRRTGLREAFELTFFAPMEQPGIRMGKKAYESLGPDYRRRGIARQVGVPIARFSAEGVEFADGNVLPADLVMFIPAGTGHPVLTGSGLATTEAGFLDIDSGCLVAGTTNVYAVGDSAAMAGPDWRAKQVHMAEVMGRVAAHNIAYDHEGRSERESYLDHVTLVCLMDVGNGANLVYRTSRREGIIPLPVVGHWAKRAWGWYAGATKLRRFPRMPGL